MNSTFKLGLDLPVITSSFLARSLAVASPKEKWWVLTVSCGGALLFLPFLMDILTLPGEHQTGAGLGVTRVIVLINSEVSMILDSTGSFQTPLIFSVSSQTFFFRFVMKYWDSPRFQSWSFLVTYSPK